MFRTEVTVTFSSTVKPKQHCRAKLGSTVPVWATDAERWWLQEEKKKQLLSDWGGIEATSKWQRGGAGGGRAPTSVHLSFICLISSDALPSRKGGTLGSHSISPPGFLTIHWYWRRVILKDLLSHSQLYLEVGGSLGDPLGEAPRRCVVSPEQRTPEWLHLVHEFLLAVLKRRTMFSRCDRGGVETESSS